MFTVIIKANVQHSVKHDGRAQYREIVPVEVNRCRRLGGTQAPRREKGRAGVFAAAYAGQRGEGKGASGKICLDWDLGGHPASEA